MATKLHKELKGYIHCAKGLNYFSSIFSSLNKKFTVIWNHFIIFFDGINQQRWYINLRIVLIYHWDFYSPKLRNFLCPRDRRSGGILFLSCVILSLCHSLWNFNLANNFWTLNARALIFHMSIPCDKTFPWVPLFMTRWPWPWSLTHFLKFLTLVITFEQWVLEIWYFTWIFLVIRFYFCGYHYVWPCGLDLRVWSIF